MLHVHDILDFLVARSMAPSTMGAQLDRLRNGVQIAPDPFRARAEAEDHMMGQALLIRCIDQFQMRPKFAQPTRQRKAADAGFKILTKIQDKTRPERSQGEIALGILRAYQERSTQSQERGLVEVYNFIASIAPEVVPGLPKGQSDMLMAFRTNTAKRARCLAAEAYADSLLALQYHVRVFSKKCA